MRSEALNMYKLEPFRERRQIGNYDYESSTTITLLMNNGNQYFLGVWRLADTMTCRDEHDSES